MPLIALSCVRYTLSKGKLLFPLGNCEVKHGEPHELDHDFLVSPRLCPVFLCSRSWSFLQECLNPNIGVIVMFRK